MQIFRFFFLVCFCFGFFLKADTGYAQTLKISGKVLQAGSDIPLQGISVIARPSRIGVVSNADGSFQLSAKPGDTIYFSSVGYKTFKYAVTKSQSNLKILLSQQSVELKEVEVNSRPSAEKINRALRNMKRAPEPDPMKAPPPPEPLLEEKVYTPNEPIVYKNPVSFLYDQFSKEGKQREKMAEIMQQKADSVKLKKQAEYDKLFLDRNRPFK